jgi:predicted site-specific integrase-resolvase
MSTTKNPMPSQPDDEDEKLPLSKAAKMCGVDYDTFLRWVLKGAVPYVVVGPHNRKRVRRRDVNRLIRSGS